MVDRDQAFSPSYDFSPSPFIRKLFFFLSLLVFHQSSLLTAEGAGGGGGAKFYGHEKAWTSMYHAIPLASNGSTHMEMTQVAVRPL
jgi:hypothetical protein